MADLPLEGRVVEKTDKKDVPLTVQEQVDLLRKDVVELARGVNTQARLLEAIVNASDHVVKVYLELTKLPEGVASEAKEETK